MRKLLISLSALALFVSGTAFAFNDSTFGGQMIKRQTGTRASEGVRVLKLVRYPMSGNSVTMLSSGDAVVYSLVSDDGISVITTTTSADNSFAGIVVANIPSSDGAGGTSARDDEGKPNWGYILVHGMGNANVTLGGTNGNVAGDPFITSTDQSHITTIGAISVDLASSTGMNVKAIKVATARGGFFYDAGDTTSSQVEVYVNVE